MSSKLLKKFIQDLNSFIEVNTNHRIKSFKSKKYKFW